MNSTTVGSEVSARPIARAEAVGSLLRPKSITTAINTLYAGMSTAMPGLILQDKSLQLQQFSHAADAEIRRLIQRQINAGLDVVTDGELRRGSFLSCFYDAAEGLGAAESRFEVQDDQGQVIYSGYADPVVTGPLRKASSTLALEATFLRSVTDFPFKLTLPAPSYFLTHFVPAPREVYPHRQQLVENVIEIERSLILEAIAAGANWIQFDFPLYPGLVDEKYLSGLLSDLRIESREALLHLALGADKEITKMIPEEVTVGLHICRGNFEGGFWNGSLAPIAEKMFNELPHDRFLIEWEDTEREGTYEPIKFVPKGRTMAMGLVSTKNPRVETVTELIQRLETAAKYLDLEQLALCTQCGFASLCGDHLVQAEDAQWRKLEVIGQVADRVWGAR